MVRKGYKKTDVGVIPEDWDVICLIDGLVESPKYGINAAAVEFNESLPTYLRITDITDDGRFNSAKKVSVDNSTSNNYYLKDNDLVFARTGASTGKTYLYDSQDGKLVYAGFLIKVSINERVIYPRFLKAYTQTKTYWNWVRIISMRSGQPGINGNEYAKLCLPFLSLPEQKAIATVLTDTDNLITSLEKLIDKKKKIKQGTMQQLLTGKKRLAGFSGEWEEKKLVDVSNVMTGSTPSTNDKSYYGKDYMFVSPIDMGSNKYIHYTEKMLSEKGFGVSRKYPIGSILVTCIGSTIGKVGMILEKATSNQQINAVIPFENISSDFIYYYFECFNKFIRSKASEQAVPIINKSTFEKIILKLPKKYEQEAIVSILSDMDAEIELIVQRYNKYKTIKQGMMQELLTGRTRLI